MSAGVPLGKNTVKHGSRHSGQRQQETTKANDDDVYRMSTVQRISHY